MIKRIKKGSISYQILELLSYSTEISPKIFHQMKDYHYNVYMNEVVRMTKSHTYVNDFGDMIENIKVLSIIGKGKFKTIRLMRRAYEDQFLKLLNTDAYERYETNAYHKYQNHYNTSFIERHHNLTELYLQFKNNQIEDYWFNKKACLPVQQGGLFITSQTIKGSAASRATIQGRSYGVLIFLNNSYVIYYYENETSYWSSEAEARTKNLVRKTIQEKIEAYQDKDEAYFDNAIIMGSNIKSAYNILIGKDNNRRIRINTTYRNYHFILKTHINEMLNILKNNVLITEKLIEKTFGDNHQKSKLIDCDGIIEDGSYLLFTFDLNLNRMKRFKKNCDYYDDKKFIVYGFDWQKTLLIDYYDGNNSEIYSITFEVLMKVLELTEDGGKYKTNTAQKI